MRNTTPAVLLSALLLLASAAFGQEKPIEQTTDPAVVTAALEKAHAEKSPYHLRVDCTGEKGPRNLEVFPSGAAIWDERAQFDLDAGVRTALLEILLRHDFAALKPLYGGKRKPGETAEDKTDGKAEGAALRVRCRVEVILDGLRRGSAQDSYGEQSAELLALATELLDRVEPLAEKKAIVVADLDDGLAKVADGTLVPEAMEVRFLELPGRGGKGGGTIFRFAGGTAVARPYEPGRELGEETAVEMPGGDLARLVEALQNAGYSEFPVNLWSDEHLELEVRVLDHRKAVSARSFGRLTPDSLGETQEKFDRLVDVLRELRSGVAAP